MPNAYIQGFNWIKDRSLDCARLCFSVDKKTEKKLPMVVQMRMRY
jgi:hypothetical protein